MGITGGILGSIIIGSGLGATEAAVTGGNPASGAEFGAITGVGSGLGGQLGGDVGSFVGSTAGGALGAEVTGGKPLTGALEGGAASLISSGLSQAFSGPSGGASAAPGASAGGVSAMGLGAPPGDLGGGGITVPNNPISFGDASGGASVLTSGEGAPVFTGAGASPPTGSVALGSQIGNVGTGLNLSSAPATGAIIPAGLDPTAAANFAAEGTANPYGSGVVNAAINGGGGATGTGGGTAAAPQPGFFQNLSSGNIGGALGQIPASAYLGAAGIGYEALKGQPAIPNLSNLNQIAGQLQGQEASLLNPLASGGPLPAGAQSSIDQGVQSAQAAIRSQFASMGLSGSSMEQSALAEAEQSGVQQRFQVAQQMAGTGAQLAGLDINTYNSIMQTILGQDNQLQNSIVNFATAAAGGGPKIQIGGNSTA